MFEFILCLTEFFAAQSFSMGIATPSGRLLIDDPNFAGHRLHCYQKAFEHGDSSFGTTYYTGFPLIVLGIITQRFISCL
jgi:hypothetical protein